MNITFPTGESAHTGTETVSFAAIVDGQKVTCRISYEALHDNYACGGGQPIECFRSNRSSIENKARQLLEVHRIEADGTLLIQSGDGA